MTGRHPAMDVRRLCLSASAEDAARTLRERGIGPSDLVELLQSATPAAYGPGMHVVELQPKSGDRTAMVVHVPVESQGARCGAIVLLHGAGSSGRQIAEFAGALCRSTGLYVLCPTATAAGPVSSNFELGGLFGKRVQHPRWHYGADAYPVLALKWALQHLQADPDRCVLVGHSMGAVATWNVAARYWHSWAGAAPINGALSVWERFGPDGEAAAILPNLVQVPVQAVHGSIDRRIPAELEAVTIKALRARGNANAAQVLVGGGDHPLSTMGLVPGSEHFEALASWAVARRRNPYPRCVSHCTLDLSHGRSHWIEVIELGQPGCPAQVHAEVADPHEIIVQASGARRLALHFHHRFVNPGDVRIVVNGRILQHHFAARLECLIDAYRATFDTGLLSEDTLTIDILDHGENAEEGENKWTANTTC